MSDLNLDELKKLRNDHLKNLRNLFDTSQPSENSQINNSQLKEYFQYLHNSLDSNDLLKYEQEKSKKIKLNDNILKETQAQNKRFEIDWNLEYCNACKCSYWPLNCTVYIEPKSRYTKTNAKLVTRYKLFNFKPKYKSYKDVLLKKLINKGIRLIYECKRCKTKNCILYEVKRPDTKCLKVNKVQAKKHQDKLIKSSEFSFNSQNRKFSACSEIVVNTKKFNTRKKFQSLQTQLKQNEIEQELAKKEQEKNRNKFGSLADFLQKIS